MMIWRICKVLTEQRHVLCILNISAFTACLFDLLLVLYGDSLSFLCPLGHFLGLDDSTASLVISVRTGFEPCNSFYFAVLRTPFDI